MTDEGVPDAIAGRQGVHLRGPRRVVVDAELAARLLVRPQDARSDLDPPGRHGDRVGEPDARRVAGRIECAVDQLQRPDAPEPPDRPGGPARDIRGEDDAPIQDGATAVKVEHVARVGRCGPAVFEDALLEFQRGPRPVLAPEVGIAGRPVGVVGEGVGLLVLRRERVLAGRRLRGPMVEEGPGEVDERGLPVPVQAPAEGAVPGARGGPGCPRPAT